MQNQYDKVDEIHTQKIREKAFHLWQQAGCPAGMADKFWLQAEQAELAGDTRGEDIAADESALSPAIGDSQNFA